MPGVLIDQESNIDTPSDLLDQIRKGINPVSHRMTNSFPPVSNPTIEVRVIERPTHRTHRQVMTGECRGEKLPIPHVRRDEDDTPSQGRQRALYGPALLGQHKLNICWIRQEKFEGRVCKIAEYPAHHCFPLNGTQTAAQGNSQVAGAPLAMSVQE